MKWTLREAKSAADLFKIADVIVGQKMDDSSFRNEILQHFKSIEFYAKWPMTRFLADNSLNKLTELIWRQIGILKSQMNNRMLTNTHHNINHTNLGLINGGVTFNVKYAMFVYLPAMVGLLNFSFIVSGNTANLTNEMIAKFFSDWSIRK